jgi:hypothetical protein
VRDPTAFPSLPIALALPVDRTIMSTPPFELVWMPHISLRSGVALSLALITARLTHRGTASLGLTVHSMASAPSPAYRSTVDTAVTAISFATPDVMASSGGGTILRIVAVLGGVVV